MDGQLKAGTFLTSESSNKYKVNTLLGAGGQGEVYDVECGGKHYALKWYFKHMATKSQKEILDNLITRGAPDDSFLWPQDLIFKGYGESFGYIMPLRPKNFKSIVDMMKRRAEPSFRTLCKAAYKGIEIHEAEACKDHIHMLVSIPPKYSVSQIMGYLKGKSSLMIYEKYANLKYKYGNRHFWCRGYYVSTVGRNRRAIEEYIKNQLQEDYTDDQLSIKEFVDPFTGEPVRGGK